MKKKHILSLTPQELKNLLVEWGEPEYRYAQLINYTYKHYHKSFNKMYNLPSTLRSTLSNIFNIRTITIQAEKPSKDQETRKLLLSLQDNNLIEMVIITHPNRRTVCISTQVGCPLACKFCATGKLGFKRNLSVGEIVEQVLIARELYGIKNVVFMGMGEPFLNYSNVKKALQIIHHPKAIGIGWRHITISTAGIPKYIRQIAKDFPQVRLAVSLTATTNKKRSKLMPINNKYPLETIYDALDTYQQITNRRFTFEYTLFKNINTNYNDALRLQTLSKRLNFILNLIEYNPVPEVDDLKPPTRKEVIRFTRMLRDLGVKFAIRRKKGTDIYSGCGQLALYWAKLNLKEEKSHG